MWSLPIYKITDIICTYTCVNIGLKQPTIEHLGTDLNLPDWGSFGEVDVAFRGKATLKLKRRKLFCSQQVSYLNMTPLASAIRRGLTVGVHR